MQLRILNGRISGDSLGYYTCFKHNGCSTVDYIITSQYMMKKVISLRVEPHIHPSDHGLIAMTIPNGVMVPTIEAERPLEPTYGRNLWDTESAKLFRHALLSEPVSDLHSRLLVST